MYGGPLSSSVAKPNKPLMKVNGNGNVPLPCIAYTTGHLGVSDSAIVQLVAWKFNTFIDLFTTRVSAVHCI